MTFQTDKGDIACKLFETESPIAVRTMVGLAIGKMSYRDPRTGTAARKRFFDGLTFHRVIPNFMIQGGDPLGRGTGGPGYQFEDEFQSGRRFDRPGLLAMANSGRNTNGSQFFITVVPTPWLNDKHTIFGEVVSGMEVVKRVANEVPKGAGDRPRKDVTIRTLTISENP